jgi:hypothetical protein
MYIIKQSENFAAIFGSVTEIPRYRSEDQDLRSEAFSGTSFRRHITFHGSSSASPNTPRSRPAPILGSRRNKNLMRKSHKHHYSKHLIARSPRFKPGETAGMSGRARLSAIRNGRVDRGYEIALTSVLLIQETGINPTLHCPKKWRFSICVALM